MGDDAVDELLQRWLDGLASVGLSVDPWQVDVLRDLARSKVAGHKFHVLQMPLLRGKRQMATRLKIINEMETSDG
jgi:hypothetical protein